MAEVEDQNMTEVEEETEAMDAEDGTVVNGKDEEASKEEIKEDAKDTKKRNKPAVFFMPAIHEFKSDMTRYQLSRSVVIGPIELKELNKKALSTTLRSTNTIQMGYHRVASGDYMGYMQMVFSTEEEAADAVVKLQKMYKEPVTVKHCVQGSHKEPIKYEDVNIAKEYAAESHFKPDNAVAIPDLAEEVTEEDLSDIFPNAMIVYIPKYKAEEGEAETEVEVKAEETEVKEEEAEAEMNDDGEVKKEVTENGDAKEEEKKGDDKPKKIKKAKRYAYVCFSNAEDAAAAVDQEFKLHEKEYRVTKLEALPPVDVIIRSIDAEKLLHFPGSFNQLPNDKKVRIYTLRRQAMHYIRTDYLSEKKLRNLQQRMDVLSQITQQGRRGGRGGKRPGPPGGGYQQHQTPNKRPRNDSFAYSPRGGPGFSPRGRGGYGGGYGGGYDAWAYPDYGYGGYGGGYGAPYGGGPPRGQRSRGRGGRGGRW